MFFFCLGFPDQALARNSTAIAKARRLAHPPSLAVSLSIGSRLLSLIGYNAVLGEWADELVATATEQGFPSGVRRERSIAGMSCYWEAREVLCSSGSTASLVLASSMDRIISLRIFSDVSIRQSLYGKN